MPHHDYIIISSLPSFGDLRLGELLPSLPLSVPDIRSTNLLGAAALGIGGYGYEIH